MSMNLNVRCNGKKLELWQTPTSITRIITSNHKGDYYCSWEGKKARRAVYGYLEWVKGSADGVREDIEAHVAPLYELLANPDNEFETYVI